MIWAKHFNRVRIILAGLVLLPLAAAGQTTNLYRTIYSGEMDLMTVPLNITGGNTLSNIFHDVPTGSEFYFWDKDLETWNVGETSAKGWAYSLANTEVLPGEAFFFKPAWTYTVHLNGIPPTPLVTNVVSGYGEVSILGHPYPIDILWTDSQLADQLPPGSMVSFWDRTNKIFHTTLFKAPLAKGGGWGTAASNTLIRAVDGFAVKQYGTNFTWSE